jgi:L-2-hydroxyglutarate oxidase LhgO
VKRVCVIGGGVIGCHVALAFAEAGYEVFVIEKHARVGQETSTRNSCVLHAGIYYRQGSLKARLCVEGNALSREFFSRHGVAWMETGKYIISRSEEEDAELDALMANAQANGAPGMRLASSKEIERSVPFIDCRSAIFSASTAIIDTGEYMQVLNGLLFQRGAHLVTECRACGFGESAVYTDRGEIECDIAVNAAGLYCDELALAAGIEGYEVRPLKGDYYVTRSLSLRVPVYPVPNHTHKTLGVHLTPTFGSEVMIGPSEWPSSGRDNYLIETPRPVFEESLKSMIRADAYNTMEIYEGFAGNRPRAYFHGERCDDFVIIRKPGWVIHLIAFESPGLTSAPAIARHVASIA